MLKGAYRRRIHKAVWVRVGVRIRKGLVLGLKLG